MSDIRNPHQWEPVTAPIQNAPGVRSPEALRAVAAQFDVEHNPRYQRTPVATFCNIFAWDFTRAMSAEIPHWIDDEKAPKGRRELNVNATIEWLNIAGHSVGWREVDSSEAQRRADLGHPTVVLWKNPAAGHHGHIAVLLPSRGNGIRIAQAGSHNYFDVPLVSGFGSHGPLHYFTHE